MKHRTNFTSGAASDVKEREQLGRRAALEAFGYVVRHGKGGAAELIAQVARL